MKRKKQLRIRLTASQMITLGFGSLILVGALLLMTPFASKSGGITHFLDALFAANSEIWVTGFSTLQTN